MKRYGWVGLVAAGVVLAGCSAAPTAAPSTLTLRATITSTAHDAPVTVRTTAPGTTATETFTQLSVDTETVTSVSTTTYAPEASSRSSASAESSSAAKQAAAKGKGDYENQMKAAGLEPDPEDDLAMCQAIDQGEDPFDPGSELKTSDDWDTFVAVHSGASFDDSTFKEIQITVHTLCPVHSKSLDAAVKRADAAAKAEAAQDQVTYSVHSDSGGADVTYALEDFNTAQENDVSTPWSKTVTIPADDSRVLSLLAQNDGGGQITCSIAIAGKVIKTVTSSGDYAIADCSAS